MIIRTARATMIIKKSLRLVMIVSFVTPFYLLLLLDLVNG